MQERLTFINDFYSDKYAAYQADFVCCKMTLEHIQQTAEFVSLVRHGIGDRSETVVFFQVPDVARILQELAFWDVYYEPFRTLAWAPWRVCFGNATLLS